MIYKVGDKVRVAIYENDKDFYKAYHVAEFIIPDGYHHTGKESKVFGDIICEIVGVLNDSVLYCNDSMLYCLDLSNHDSVVAWRNDGYIAHLPGKVTRGWQTRAEYISGLVETATSATIESGATCKRCKMFNEYAPKNDNYICYNCR